MSQDGQDHRSRCLSLSEYLLCALHVTARRTPARALVSSILKGSLKGELLLGEGEEENECVMKEWMSASEEKQSSRTSVLCVADVLQL